MSGERHDPYELKRALRAAYPEPPMDAVDWDRLHSRILHDARRVLDQAAGRRPWWDIVAGWAARGVPITATVAAAAALALFLGGPPLGGVAGEYDDDTTHLTLEDALTAEAGLLLTAESADEVLVSAILYDTREEW